MIKRRRTDNTMVKRRRTDNTMIKRKRTKEDPELTLEEHSHINYQALIYHPSRQLSDFCFLNSY
jgi:hypothetical protein